MKHECTIAIQHLHECTHVRVPAGVYVTSHVALACYEALRASNICQRHEQQTPEQMEEEKAAATS